MYGQEWSETRVPEDPAASCIPIRIQLCYPVSDVSNLPGSVPIEEKGLPP